MVVAFLAFGWWSTEQTVRQVKTELEQTTRSVMEVCEQFSRTPPTVRPLRKGGDGPEMLIISAGSSCQGDVSGVGASHERPVRVVEFARAFAIGRYEVTVGEFTAFVKATGYRTEAEEGDGCYTGAEGTYKKSSAANWRTPGFPQTERHPVVCVSWNDAQRYIDWLNQQTGKRYRLPSESEWQYATRAGTITSRFWGDDEKQACSYANVFDAANAEALQEKYGIPWEPFPCEDGYVETAPVDAKEFQPNPLGLSQALGNVWEWTADCWHDSYEGAPSDGSAWTERGGGDCSRRVIRGGSWDFKPDNLRSARRDWTNASNRSYGVGFRLAQDLDR